MTYIFKTTTTLKENDFNGKWWIDPGMIPDMEIEAESINEALNEWKENVESKCYVEISKNAMKRKNEMYRDLPGGGYKQVGYVITGKTDFEKEKDRTWVSKYIDLWVEIVTVIDTDFDAAA